MKFRNIQYAAVEAYVRYLSRRLDVVLSVQQESQVVSILRQAIDAAPWYVTLVVRFYLILFSIFVTVTQERLTQVLIRAADLVHPLKQARVVINSFAYLAILDEGTRP